MGRERIERRERERENESKIKDLIVEISNSA
jgi:hypothetical protein